MTSEKHGKDWTRPKAQKKDRNYGSWLVLLGVLCLVGACWNLIQSLYWKIKNRHEDSVERVASCFVALSYDGVTTNPQDSGTFISTKAFEAQIIALKNAGYHPICLEDVVEFYDNGRKLPKKAVLITFEDTQRSSYFTTRKFLDEMEWHAVMGVVTGDVRAENESVILSPYLRDMEQSDTWDLACESSHGSGVVKIDHDSHEAMFFSVPAWIDKESRYESLSEFNNRIIADHTAALFDFTNSLALKPPRAFFFPKGNYGQFEARNLRLRDANFEAISSFYKLGFAIDDFGYNDASSDRRCLNRMKVEPKWSTEEFLERVEAAWPQPLRGGWGTRPEDSLIPARRWRATWGILDRLSENGVTLSASSPLRPLEGNKGATGGAKAFVCGSNPYREGMVNAKFQLIKGGFMVYTHYKDSGNNIAFSLSEDNGAAISRTTDAEDPVVLAHEELDYLRNGARKHDLMMISRGATVFVILDGRMLFGGAVRVGAEAPPPGFVGIGVWSDVPGAAQTDILEFHISKRRPQFITWDDAVTENETHIFKELEYGAYRYDFVALPWIKANDGGTIFIPTVDAEALALVTEKTQATIWPIIRLKGYNPFDLLPMDTISESLKEHHVGGVVLDARALETESLPQMKQWIASLGKTFQDSKLPVAIAFPPKFNDSVLLSGFIESIPGCRVIADNDIPLTGVPQDVVAGWLRIEPPDSNDLEVYFKLAEFDKRPTTSTPGDVNFRRQLRKMFDEQDYGNCEKQLALWRAREPNNPEVWNFAARLYAKLHRNTEAYEAYQKSLDCNSAQIDIVIELADYLATLERSRDIVELLDRYAKAFPDNRQIALAQAKWLDAHEHRPEARDILAKLIERQPDNIDLRITRHSYLDDPADRYDNMHHIVDLVTRNPKNLMWFRQKIETAGLLTYQESSLCFDLIRATVTNSLYLTVRRSFEELIPIEEPVVELFKSGRISPHWTLFGTAGDTMAGEYLLPKLPDPSEAHLRFLRSDLLRDGFIEVQNGDSMGAFWLYARRSNLGMVRFGYDNDGFLRIQAWQNGEMCAADSVLWVRPKGNFTLRLEIRGDGAVGYFDGKEVFSTPLSIPRAVGYGWWGVASSAAASGMAQTQLKRLSAGPESPTIAVMDCYRANFTARMYLDAIRPVVRDISAISPIFCRQEPDGSLPIKGREDMIAYRMFASYNRLRLMPTIALDYYAETPIDSLMKMVKANQLDGLVLCVRRMPSDKWMAELEKTLEKHFVSVIILLSRDGLWTNQGEVLCKEVSLHEIQRSNLLLHPNKVPWRTTVKDFSEWVKKAHHPENREHNEPQVVVVTGIREKLPESVEAMLVPISIAEIEAAAKKGDENAWARPPQETEAETDSKESAEEEEHK